MLTQQVEQLNSTAISPLSEHFCYQKCTWKLNLFKAYRYRITARKYRATECCTTLT